MNRKKTLLFTGALLLAGLVSFSSAYANGYRHGGWGKHGGGDDLAGKFFMKAHFIMAHKEALGLPEDKIKAIKNLKIETKKALIRQDAEIQILSLDIKNKLHDYPVDADGVKKLMGEKYDLKKTRALALVDAFANLKSVLTKDQYEKLRGLWQTGYKEKRA